MFLQRIEADEQALFEDYGVKEIEAGGVLEILADDQNKDAIDELVTAFVEKVEENARRIDTQITKDR